MIITCAYKCLIFHNNDKVLEDLIASLKDEFQLMDEVHLETFLGVLFKKHIHNNLELTQPHLTQRIIDTLGIQE